MLWLIDGSGGESHLRRSWRNWLPVRMLELRHQRQQRKKITNVSLDPCRLLLVVRLPLSLFPLSTSELNIYSCCLIKDSCAPSSTLFSTSLTLSLTICVPCRTCAVTIRISSFVSLSSPFSASSMSPFPSSFFKYFSGSFLINTNPVTQELLTHTPLLHLLRGNPKNRKHLHHYLHNDINHLRWRRHSSVQFKTLEEIFHTLEDIDEIVLVCTNIYSCLRDVL